MSGRHSRISQLKEDEEDEILDFTRQLAITDHRRRHGPTSAPRSADFRPTTETITEEVPNKESSDSDEGGVALSSRPKDSSAESVYISPHSSGPSSSSLFDQLMHTMTPNEVESWASTHNSVFLWSLDRSMSARNQASGPQTPASRRPVIASTLHTPSSDSPLAASPGPSCLISSGYRSHQSSLTSLVASPPSLPVPQAALTPTPHPFRPNNMVLERMGVSITPPSRGLPGSSYLGRRHSHSGAREVEGLLDFENCALFLTKIPVEVTLHELFGVITTGAVFCLHINPSNGIHTTMAAKLAFMNPEAAAAFLKEIQSPRGVVLHGKRIQGRFNRNGYVRNENIWQSRVLELIGPTPMMTLEYWTSHFSKFSEFELEAYRLMPTNVDGVRIMEFRFARIDGQAQTCLQCIRTDPSLQGVIQVRYGADPCGSSTAC